MGKTKPDLTAVIVLFIILLAVFCFLSKKMSENTEFFLEKDLPLIFAHRGYSSRYPENTILAFEKAIEAGADALEMDVWYTADNVIVVHHDRDIQRTTDGMGKVENMTFEEIRQYDAGYSFTPDGGLTFPFRGTGVRIPSLMEVIEEFPDAYLNFEMKAKDKHIARLMAAFIEKHEIADRVLVASFHHKPLKEFRRLLPKVQTSASRREVRNFYIASRIRLGPLFAFSYEAFQIPVRHGNIRLDREKFIRRAKRSGIRVIYWTINDRSQMIELFEKNASGIVTDDVSSAVQLVGEIEKRRTRSDLTE